MGIACHSELGVEVVNVTVGSLWVELLKKLNRCFKKEFEMKVIKSSKLGREIVTERLSSHLHRKR